MKIRVETLMTPQVMTTQRHHTLGHVRQVMTEHRVSALPVVGSELLGIVTLNDVLAAGSDGQKVSAVMSDKVYTVPAYSDPSDAAHLMRKHRFHHLVVTHEKRIVGILSTFDLLALVEERTYVSRNPPTKPKRARDRSVIQED